MSRPLLVAGGAAVVVVIAIVVVVLTRPVPAQASSGRIAVGDSWSSPFGVAFTYERWQGEPLGRQAFHVVVENEDTAERQGAMLQPQGADRMRETFGVPWHVVSFEGMTSDGSDWIVVEARRPATAKPDTPPRP